MAHVALKSSGGPVDPELRVTLNFHPDRLASGVPILEAMGRDGVCRSQFETEALVLDPSFRGTGVEHAARRLSCPVEWHGARAGRYDDQDLKRVWHYVARFGSPG